LKINIDPTISKILTFFPTRENGAELIATLLSELLSNQTSPIAVLREMFNHYLPFRYSIENKETALQIRNKKKF